jgi:inhibitor of KinA
MQEQEFSYCIFPLGETAITIEFGNQIDININVKVLGHYNNLQQNPLPGMVEAVPAYSSLTVYYNATEIKKNIPGIITVFDWVKNQLNKRLAIPLAITDSVVRGIKIPVCYEDEMASDIEELAVARGLSREDVIKIHTGTKYRVFMLGFLPGFAYMGQVDKRIEMPRKTKPVNTPAGSVGIAGRQTGIYPLNSPGGWSIIGRTPLKLFEAGNEEGTLFRAGDEVEFYSVTKKEFDKIAAIDTKGIHEPA